MSNTHPGEYLIPLYTQVDLFFLTFVSIRAEWQYGQIGLMIAIYIFLPESPGAHPVLQ